MSDPIDRHVEAADVWEDLHDSQADAESDYQADLAKDDGFAALAHATGLWANASEAALQRMRLLYDQVRPGPTASDAE